MDTARALRRAFCLLPAALCLLAGGGCGDASVASDELVTYVCTETREVIRAAPQPMPAVHPQTGRRTLARGMYCADCAQWFPVPPDARHPERIRCRKHGKPMSLSGPD